MAGKFIVIEGPDGSGKSTQAELLVKHLADKGLEVVHVREPGGTAVGERIRKVLRDSQLSGMSVATEMLLYMACRAQLVKEIIKPALAKNKIVVADRFLLSTFVYQGIAGGLGKGIVRKIGEFVTEEVQPNLTVVLRLKKNKWLDRRMLGRARAQISLFDEAPDREEKKDLTFHEKVREAYHRLGKKSKATVVVDGNGEPLEVHQRVVEAVEDAIR